MDSNKKHLHYLDDLSGYKVASDDPDVRGWKLTDAHNNTLGTVESFLVNKDAKKVRYLDVKVEESIIDEKHDPFQNNDVTGAHEYVNRDNENHLIVPIGLARIDEENKRVITSEVDRDTFARTKRIAPKQEIDQNYERYVMKCYRNQEVSSTNTEDEFYNRDEFNENRFRNR